MSTHKAKKTDIIFNMSVTLLNKIPKQIAKPVSKANIVADKVIAQAKVLKPVEYQDLTGIGYVPFYSVQSISAANYDRSAFIQDDININAETGSGLQKDNRIEAYSAFINIYNLNVPDGDQDTNTDYFAQNYKVTDLAAEKVEDGINQTFANIEPSLQLLNANRVYFGHDFLTTTYGSTKATLEHYNGIADLFKAAIGDSPVYLDEVADLDTWGYTSSKPATRYFDLTQTSSSSVAVTPLKVFSALNNIDFKLSQPNSVFSFGNTSSVCYLSAGTTQDSIKGLIGNSKYNEIRAYNYSLYKDLEAYYSTGKLIVLQEGSLDVESVNRTSTELGLAKPLTINPTNLFLPRDCIGLYDASNWFAGEYSLGDMSEEVVTVNNLTKSVRKLQTCKFSTLLPNTVCAIVKIPSLLEDSGTLP